MPKIVFWLLGIVGPPVAVWIQTQVFGRFPAAPFLELMPARTAIGRSLSMASLLCGILGLAFFASLASGTWLLAITLLAAGVMVVGCSRAIGSYWWPTFLAGALVGLGFCVALLVELSPWAEPADLESQQALVLAAGGLVVFSLALWSSTVTVLALRRLEELGQP